VVKTEKKYQRVNRGTVTRLKKSSTIYCCNCNCNCNWGTCMAPLY